MSPFADFFRQCSYSVRCFQPCNGPPTAAQMAPPPRRRPPVLRMPNLAVGTRCFGFCPARRSIRTAPARLRRSSRFGRSEAHERDLYAARVPHAIDHADGWAEIGIAIPITLYKKSGVSPIYEPLAPFGRVRVPIEGVLGGIATTAFVRVPVVAGPFTGRLPTAMSDTPYTPPTQFELGLALHKRIGPIGCIRRGWPVQSQPAASKYRRRGAFLSLQHPDSVRCRARTWDSKCPKQESGSELCAMDSRFAAGARFSFDLGQGGLFCRRRWRQAWAGWMIGGQRPGL